VKSAAGIHPSAVIGHGARIGEGASTGRTLVSGRRGLGERVTVGRVAGSRNVAIGDGDCCTPTSPYTTTSHRQERDPALRMRDRRDGFGFILEEGGTRNSAGGRVEIGDFVEIGANACVTAPHRRHLDREGAKIDNMVHVATMPDRAACRDCGADGSRRRVVERLAVIEAGWHRRQGAIESRACWIGSGILTSKIVRRGKWCGDAGAAPQEYLDSLRFWPLPK